MEKEVTILCLVYIERLLTMANVSLEPQTWKRVVFISLVFHLILILDYCI